MAAVPVQAASRIAAPGVTPLIAFRGIGKAFPGVVALQDVSFGIAAGSCHALMGENGAGKSTLGRILAGLQRPDAGDILLDGVAHRFATPREAQRAGIGIVHQELSYCPNLSVAENCCLAALPRRGLWLDRSALRTQAHCWLDAVGASCDPNEELGRLSAGQIQLVQIAAALATGARILVMDEPTSSLSSAEARTLESLLWRLRREGRTIIYVSHRMDEIFRLCDTATVLRDGRHVATLPLAGTDADQLIRLMIGRPLAAQDPVHLGTEPREERLRVERLSSPGRFRDVSFHLRTGEVLGVAGLVGAGRSELVQAIAGLDPEATGRVLVEGIPVCIRDPRRASAHGIGLLAEDRKRQGIVPDMACRENLTLSALDCPGGRGPLGRALHCPWCARQEGCMRWWSVVRRARERDWTRELFARLRVRAASPEVPIATLSGGNQQKILLARRLVRSCRVLLLDEPTRGVDVGAKAEIHALIGGLAASGHAVLMISSELPELLHLSNRILVMRDGRLVGEVPRAAASQEAIMNLMAGRSASMPSTEAISHDR